MKLNLLLEDKFNIESIDTNNFENVTRFSGRTSIYNARLVIDINVSIFPINKNYVLEFAFYHTNEDKLINSANLELEKVMSDWEYVVYGTIINEETEKSNNSNFKSNESGKIRALYMSFGGLMCSLSGERMALNKFILNKRLFLMMRKSSS